MVVGMPACMDTKLVWLVGSWPENLFSADLHDLALTICVCLVCVLFPQLNCSTELIFSRLGIDLQSVVVEQKPLGWRKYIQIVLGVVARLV